MRQLRQISLIAGLLFLLTTMSSAAESTAPATAADAYRSMARTIDPRNADAHFALALWCSDHGLTKEMTAELNAAVQADPDHAAARAKLGQVKTDKGWLPIAEAMRAKGLVLAGGRWVTKEEAARQEQAERTQKTLLFITSAVTKIHTLPDPSDWELKLSMIDDPAVAPRMTGLLGNDPTPAVRRAACGSLASIGKPENVAPLVRSSLQDDDASVRNAALDAVLRLDSDAGRNIVCKSIVANLNQRVQTKTQQKDLERFYSRSAVALGRFGGMQSVPYLIAVLRPAIQIMSDPSFRPGIFIQPGDGMDELGLPTSPAAPEVAETRYYFNEEAEAALRKLTGKNFGVLPKDWQQWWDDNKAKLLPPPKPARPATTLPAGKADK